MKPTPRLSGPSFPRKRKPAPIPRDAQGIPGRAIQGRPAPAGTTSTRRMASRCIAAHPEAA